MKMVRTKMFLLSLGAVWSVNASATDYGNYPGLPADTPPGTPVGEKLFPDHIDNGSQTPSTDPSTASVSTSNVTYKYDACQAQSNRPDDKLPQRTATYATYNARQVQEKLNDAKLPPLPETPTDETLPDGRADFFIETAEGDQFNKQKQKEAEIRKFSGYSRRFQDSAHRVETNEHALDMPNLLEAKKCAEYARSSNPAELSYWEALKRKGRFCMHPEHAADDSDSFDDAVDKKYYYIYAWGQRKMALEVCGNCYASNKRPEENDLAAYTVSNVRKGYFRSNEEEEITIGGEKKKVYLYLQPVDPYDNGSKLRRRLAESEASFGANH